MSFTIPNTFGSQSGNVPSTQLDDNFIAIKNWADAPDVPTRPPGDSTTQAASTAFVSNAIGTSPLGSFRNAIINGDMMIDQRKVGAASTPAATSYLIDRFKLGMSVGSKLSFQQVVDAPVGLKYSSKITVASSYSPAAADVFTFQQLVEGYNIIRFGFGTSGPQVATVSFWVKGSVPGTYCVSINNPSGARAYVANFPVTGVWTRQSITFTCDNTGTWPTDASAGLIVTIDLGSGTNFNTTPLLWANGNLIKTAGSVGFVSQVNGSTLNIAGLQLEIGPSATAFESLPFDVQLQRCQRYFEKSFNYSVAPAQNVGFLAGDSRSSANYAGAVTNRAPSIPLQVRKRVTGGTLVTYNPGAANANFWDLVASASCPFSGGAASERDLVLNYTGAAGTAAGNSVGIHWTVDTEL